jgi:hypothetical protein
MGNDSFSSDRRNDIHQGVPLLRSSKNLPHQNPRKDWKTYCGEHEIPVVWAVRPMIPTLNYRLTSSPSKKCNITNIIGSKRAVI